MDKSSGSESDRSLIPPGTKVWFGGRLWLVGAVGWVGERYYWLERGGDVAMLPATVVEKEKREETNQG